MPVQIQHRRDTLSNWETANPVLADGERGIEKDTMKEKIGDGVTEWNNLPYFGGGVAGEATVFSVAGKTGDVLIVWGDVENTPTSVAGYGITDVYTSTEVDTITGNIDAALANILGV